MQLLVKEKITTINTILPLMFEKQMGIFSLLDKYIDSQTNLVVGVSGGSDSMFLSVLVRQYMKSRQSDKILFLHLNHGIREESKQEEIFIQNFFPAKQLQIINRESSCKNTENDLRKRRYDVFNSTMEQFKSDLILLGHHLDDRIETTFLNLLRGCGITGILGIKELDCHHLLSGKRVLRPLLSLRKQEITELCSQYGIPFVNDLTNDDSQVSIRNEIRLNVLPQLYAQEGFENCISTIYQKYENLKHKNLLVPIQQSPFRGTKGAYSINIPREDLSGDDVVSILKSLHSSGGITQAFVGDLLAFLRDGVKGWKRFNGLIFFVSHDRVYIFGSVDVFREKFIDKEEKIPNINQTIRYPRKGDRYKGKTRNKYCIAQKIPVFWRNFVPVIVEDGKIIKVIYSPSCLNS